MKTKSSAHYQREYRNRLREKGLVKKEVWVLPENGKHLLAVEKVLREKVESNFAIGAKAMAINVDNWTVESLYQALLGVEPFQNGLATIEVIDGIEPSLHIEMTEYGDLPVFLTVSGDQIIVDALLWPLSQVNDVAEFNDTVLRTHKYFPLSTISLGSAGAEDFYYMFGALSSTSLLSNIVFEIEMLANNVIQATDAYRELLVDASIAS